MALGCRAGASERLRTRVAASPWAAASATGPVRVTRVPQRTPALSARMGSRAPPPALADDQTGADAAVDRVTARVAGARPEQVQPVRRHAPAVVGHRDGPSFDLV